MSTISNGVYVPVAISDSGYPSPLTITNTGSVETSSVGVYSHITQPILVNYGTIQGNTVGVSLTNGGSVTNNATYASISGGTNGVYITGAPGYVSNYGTIEGTADGGVVLNDGGTVTNTGTGAYITGYNAGVRIDGAAGTVSNAGTIQASGANATSVYFAGNYSDTVINSGTIASQNGGDAVLFDGNGADRVVVETGAAFYGDVVGGSGSNTLELAAGTSGTLSLNGSTITGVAGTTFENFGTIVIDYPASWYLSGSTTIASGISLVVDGTLTSTGTLTNAGSVTGYGTLVIDPSTLVNTGYLGTEVALDGGSYLSNSSTGTITSNANYAVYGTDGATVVNAGTISSTNIGVELQGGGSVNNSGSISYGLSITGAAGYVSNYGAITGLFGVELSDGGTVYNAAGGSIGSYLNAVAIEGAAGTVTNDGTIKSDGALPFSNGVYLQNGGSVTNSGTHSYISGYRGVYVLGAAGTVTNDGIIEGSSAFNDGVDLAAGGSVSNSGTASYITGFNGVRIFDASGTVSNDGTIVGVSAFGVYLGDGGSVTNDTSTYAYISGADDGVGIYNAAGTVVNDGTITELANGLGNSAVVLNDGGSVTNSGAASDIYGANYGVNIGTNPGYVSNAGTIAAGYLGVLLNAGGSVYNSGLISGATGIEIFDSGTVTNDGTIQGSGVGPGYGGILLEAGGNVTNAVIGYISAANYGVVADEVAYLSNAGSIIGGSDGVDFSGGGSVANVGAASYISGAAGIDIGGAAGTVTNYGTIRGSGVGPGYGGVVLEDGGSFSNVGSASYVYGALYGVNVIAGAGYVSNAGEITGGGLAVVLKDGGSVGNSGLISGYVGVGIVGYGTVSNSGSIIATGVFGSGVDLKGGGGVTNTDIASYISGNYYGVILAGGGTVTNYGTIEATGNLNYTTGVELVNGGSIANSGTHSLISGYEYGVEIRGGAGYVNNGGTITGGFVGVLLRDGGSVGNSGTISAYIGIVVANHAGTVTNTGTVEATGGAGVGVYAGGNFANSSTAAYVLGYVGVVVGSGGTVTNAGTIAGSGRDAVDFQGHGNNRLIVDPGAVFTGNVATTGTHNTLELAAGATTGIVSHIGTEYQNFGSIIVDPSASWDFASSDTIAHSGTLEIGAGATVSGTIAFGGASGDIKIDGSSLSTAPALAIGTTIADWVSGDIVDLTGVKFTGGNADLLGGNKLQIIENGGTYNIQLNPSDDFTGDYFHLTSDGSNAFAGAGGTEITEDQTACYCRGTLILTTRGEMPVEALAIGDRVVTISGEARPIKWIGRRAYSGRFVAGNRDVLPIGIAADAFADGVPARDLWVSPEHALYLDGMLVPARHLVNAVTIVQAEAVETVEYFHIELDSHDVIFAEGAPAETFIDDDSRSMFHNVAEFFVLYPEEEAAREPAAFYAPRVEDGLALEKLRRELLARARHLDATGGEPQTGLDGRLEIVSSKRIKGWAFDRAAPDSAVPLVILADGVEIGRAVADRYRGDLERAGVGDGRHAFEFVVPDGLAAGVLDKIAVCFAADWSPLRAPRRRVETPAAA